MIFQTYSSFLGLLWKMVSFQTNFLKEAFDRTIPKHLFFELEMARQLANPIARQYYTREHTKKHCATQEPLQFSSKMEILSFFLSTAKWTASWNKLRAGFLLLRNFYVFIPPKAKLHKRKNSPFGIPSPKRL